MIVAVGIGTLLRMLHSLSLVAIRPTYLFIVLGTGLIKKTKTPFPESWPKPILPYSPHLFDHFPLSHSRDYVSRSCDYATRILKTRCQSP